MPGPALVSVPVLEMSAASVSVSVKLAAIAPSLSMSGVTIEPLRPPVPRLSMLPAPILVPRAALTAPPSEMVTAPIATAVWPISRSSVLARAEPAPETVMKDVNVV